MQYLQTEKIWEISTPRNIFTSWENWVLDARFVFVNSSIFPNSKNTLIVIFHTYCLNPSLYPFLGLRYQLTLWPKRSLDAQTRLINTWLTITKTIIRKCWRESSFWLSSKDVTNHHREFGKHYVWWSFSRELQRIMP